MVTELKKKVSLRVYKQMDKARVTVGEILGEKGFILIYHFKGCL